MQSNETAETQAIVMALNGNINSCNLGEFVVSSKLWKENEEVKTAAETF